MKRPSEKPESLKIACSMTGEQEFAIQFKQASRVLRSIAAGTLGEASLADDVVQEAAVIALQKLDQFQPGTNFTAWMSQIVRHVAKNTMRREKRRSGTSLDKEIESQPASRVNGGSNGSGLSNIQEALSPDQKHFDDRLLRALKEVNEVARSCLLLKTLEGLDYAEISRLLDIPEGTAMSHVHRTRRFLRERLEETEPKIKKTNGHD